MKQNSKFKGFFKDFEPFFKLLPKKEASLCVYNFFSYSDVTRPISHLKKVFLKTFLVRKTIEENEKRVSYIFVLFSVF